MSSKADDVPKTNAGVEWDDDHGKEYDFTVEWDIMNNLKFWGVVAHLDAGDYWKAGGFNTEVEDNTTIYRTADRSILTDPGRCRIMGFGGMTDECKGPGGRLVCRGFFPLLAKPFP